MAATPTPASTPTLVETLDLPAAFAESVAMLRTVMRTSDKESARLSAARTLANLAARFIPRPSLHHTLHAAADAPATPPTSTIATETTADAATPSPQPPDPRGQDASASSTTPTTPPTSARPRSRPRTASATAASAGAAAPTPAPTTRTVTAIPPLTEKLYPEPNEVLDPLFEVLASPIPTSPMTEAELDELQAIHANLKREDLKNPRRAARWRHQLREDRFWKAYWQEYRKNTPAFRAVRKAIMNRKPLPITLVPTSHTTPNLPSEPLASASAHARSHQLDSSPIISPHPNTS